MTPVDNPRTQTSQPPEVDAELLEALQQWKEDCYQLSAMHCGSLLNKLDSIKVVEEYRDTAGNLEAFTIGQCRILTYGAIVVSRKLTIRRDVLKRRSTLRAVMAHEMGHCIWLLAHIEDEKHLMSPFILGEKTLDQQLDTMLAKFYQDITAGNLPFLGAFDNE